MLKDTKNSMEFTTDVEEPVCKGSENDNQQQEGHPHGITDFFFNFSFFSEQKLL